MTQAYREKMRPYAQRAGQALNMQADAILTQWENESGSGTSDHARKYNNHAGIKVPTQRKFYGYKREGTPFAGYSSLDAFTQDYISNMSIGYYKNVRGQPTVEATLRALGDSPWDAGHYVLNGVNGGKLLKAAGISFSPGKPIPPKVCPCCHQPL